MSWKHLLVTAVIAVAAIAVAMRTEQGKKLLMGA